MIKYKDMKNKSIQLVYVALFFMATAMISLCMVGCDEGGIDSQVNGDPRVGTTAQASYTVSASAATIKFNVTSNTPWEISSDRSWCTVTPVSSTVSALVQEVTIATEVNPDAKSRTAVLTIKGYGVENQAINVTQDAKGELNVAMFETGELFGRAGGTREFTIYSNKPWTVTSDKAWLTFDVNSGEGSDEVYRIKATVAENSGNLRRALITIKTNSVDSIYEILQDGNQLEVTNMADSVYHYAGETISYRLQANLPWVAEVISGNEWIHIVSEANGNGNFELEVKADANPIFIGRRGQVRIKPATSVAGMENVILNVVQGTGLWVDATDDGSVSYTETGAVVISSASSGGGKKARLVTNGPVRLGVYTWKFASVDIPEGSNGYFDINGWPDVSPSTANYHIFLKNTNPTFSIGGGFNWDWADNRIVLGDKKLNDLKTLVLKLEHDPDQADKIIFRLYFNEDLVLERKNLSNPYSNPAEVGLLLYFGLFDGAGTITIESFTIDPID